MKGHNSNTWQVAYKRNMIVYLKTIKLFLRYKCCWSFGSFGLFSFKHQVDEVVSAFSINAFIVRNDLHEVSVQLHYLGYMLGYIPKKMLRAPRWSPVRSKVLSESVCVPSRSACSPKVQGQTGSRPRSSPRATNRQRPLSGGREPRKDYIKSTIAKLIVSPHHILAPKWTNKTNNMTTTLAL